MVADRTRILGRLPYTLISVPGASSQFIKTARTMLNAILTPMKNLASRAVTATPRNPFRNRQVTFAEDDHRDDDDTQGGQSDEDDTAVDFIRRVEQPNGQPPNFGVVDMSGYTWLDNLSQRKSAQERKAFIESLTRDEGKELTLDQSSFRLLKSIFKTAFSKEGLQDDLNVPLNGEGTVLDGMLDFVDDVSLFTLGNKNGVSQDRLLSYVNFINGSDLTPPPDDTTKFRRTPLDQSAAGATGIVNKYCAHKQAVSALLRDVLLAVFGHSITDLFKYDGGFTIEGVDMAGRPYIEGYALFAKVMECVSPPHLAVINDKVKDFEKICISDTVPENVRTLINSVQYHAAEVNTLAKSTKIDRDAMAKRIFEAAKKSKLDGFPKEAARQYCDYESGRLTYVTYTSNLLREHNKFKRVAQEGLDTTQKKIALLSQQQKKLETTVTNAQPSKAAAAGSDKTKKGGFKGGFDKYDNVGDTVKHPTTKETWTWYTTSKDGKRGEYFPPGHDHDAWIVNKKKEVHERNRERTRQMKAKAKKAGSNPEKPGGRRGKRDPDKSSASADEPEKKSFKSNEQGNKFRMQLKKSFVTQKVCEDNMSQADAIAAFEQHCDNIGWSKE